MYFQIRKEKNSCQQQEKFFKKIFFFSILIASRDCLEVFLSYWDSCSFLRHALWWNSCTEVLLSWRDHEGGPVPYVSSNRLLKNRLFQICQRGKKKEKRFVVTTIDWAQRIYRRQYTICLTMLSYEQICVYCDFTSVIYHPRPKTHELIPGCLDGSPE